MTEVEGISLSQFEGQDVAKWQPKCCFLFLLFGWHMTREYNENYNFSIEALLNRGFSLLLSMFREPNKSNTLLVWLQCLSVRSKQLVDQIRYKLEI